jgi:hypothetical protein
MPGHKCPERAADVERPIPGRSRYRSGGPKGVRASNLLDRGGGGTLVRREPHAVTILIAGAVAALIFALGAFVTANRQRSVA